MDLKKYTRRINFTGNIGLNIDCLKELHRCHVMSIPFEAIDVTLGRKINLKIDEVYNKVVEQNRGGYCYELNLLFHMMLKKIGFENYLISAKIFDNEQFGPEFDHMAIVVKLNEFWLADVGFGDLFLEPKQMISNHIQDDKFKSYKITELNPNEYVLSESLKEETEFKVKYKFKNVPRVLNEFNEQNIWKQSSKESYFVKNRICTLPITTGRKTILNNTYKTRIGGKIEQLEITNYTEFIDILKNEFGVEIENTS